jgi:flagellar protein FliO/FliZ
MKLLITALSVFIATTSMAKPSTAAKAKAVEKVEETAALPAKEEVAAAAAPAEISDEDLAQASQWLENADKKENQLPKIAPGLNEDEQKALANRKESEIPVLATKTADVEKKTSASSRILLSLGLVLGLLFGFSFFIKKFLKRAPLKKNSQIKILTQHYLGPKKSLAIIRVAGESMLVGITDQNINLIKTLALLDEEIPNDTPREFSKSLSNSMAGKSNTETASNNEFSAQDEEAEEFSFSKIKDFVSGRLKNMKEI